MPQKVLHLLLFAILATSSLSRAANAQTTTHPHRTTIATQTWIGTWAAGPCAPPQSGTPPYFSDETIRERIHTSIGGHSLRLTLSNTFGHNPLKLASVHIALSPQPGEITPSTDRIVTFNGQHAIIIPQNGVVLSDPIPFELPPASDLAVSLYLPEQVTEATTHYTALSSTFIASGDRTASPNLAKSRQSSSWYFLTGIAVTAAEPTASIVALGSSTTDGTASTPNMNRRWTDDLFRRLAADHALPQRSVLNQGIGGNRVLHNGAGNSAAQFGESATARFDRDVLSQPGVKFLIVFEGGNDITHPGRTAPISETVTPEQLIEGLRQIVLRAHQHGIKVIGGTITPFQGLTSNIYNSEREAMRLQVNNWILHNSDFDGAVDFAKAIADPAHPSRILPTFDSGDHLHPNDAGYQAIADSIPLHLFKY